ncbi:hypothetical protein [Nonomuraea insulae]|uniref:Uncharacterized protein n=1 Tax=Nonomuraea insulae TaxID=1616787 RepID=A0ABW1CYU2_9ACTN
MIILYLDMPDSVSDSARDLYVIGMPPFSGRGQSHEPDMTMRSLWIPALIIAIVFMILRSR